MKGSTIAGVLAGVLVLGGAILLNFGESIPVSELRPARVPCEKVVAEDCPAGVIETKDYCLCLTNKETIADEKTEGEFRCVVCERTDPEAGKHLVTRYELKALPLQPDCIIVANDLLLPGISMHNVSTGIEKKLEVTCAPCKITPDSWNYCPECAYRGDCATLCPEVSDGL